MTLKQLVDKYRFEDIIPELTELWDKGNLYLFRQAFTILQTLEPSAESGMIEVHHIESEKGAYNRVANLSGYDWDENLCWEITADEECGLSEKQILALCLWERTFYGFSPEQQKGTFKRWDMESLPDESTSPDNTYYRQLIDRKRRYYHKHVKRKNRHYDKYGLPLWPVNESEGDLHTRKKRSDKAWQRYLRSCDRLERLSEQVELIKDITSKYHTVADSDLDFLLTGDETNSYTFHGVASTRDSAIEYIIESIIRYYDPLVPKSETRCVALLCFSDGFELNQSEIARLLQVIQTKIGIKPKLIHTRRLNEENRLRLTVMYL